MEIPYQKLDVITYSWQKVLGGEAAHGILILSPRAEERIKTYDPPWPMPKIFRMMKKGKFNEGIFKGSTINTPSMLANEDYLAALDWAESVGGLSGLIKRSNQNLKAFEDFVAKHDWIDFLAESKEIRSNTSVCFSVDLPEDKIKEMVKLLADEKVAYDCGSYRAAPPGLRFWCGATVDKKDIEIIIQWLEWAFNEVK
jgi:phosphoserine aminotransferase